MLSALATGFHAIAAVVWVGGMFFAYLVLRPAVGGITPPPERLKLWDRVFSRFFLWVWAAVLILPVSGYAMIALHYGTFAAAPIHVHWMHGIGWVMNALFIYLFFAPYLAFQAAVAAQDWPTGAASLNTIRRIVAINLVLGLLTAVLGASGRYWAWIPGT
ncbi:MAG TPA: hypothetical protein DIW51_09695 [Rhodospirillaceae bacterium]|nr:hypothetical protein [Magnetovibrio sp.]HBT42284.1 hypothetical protein [Rhodospirillaceae bacterium]HCS70225.1 hypothetical protein [Rhodospirillaceae bacterium]|tara:strand:- start:305 stop:784 length:480 start_codon:yes stop_codon:yes gene_type:complete